MPNLPSPRTLAKRRIADRYKQKQAAVALSGYDPVTALAARATGLRYSCQGDGLYAVTLPDPLGKQITDSNVSIFTDGRGNRLQARANGRPLAELPYTT